MILRMMSGQEVKWGAEVVYAERCWRADVEDDYVSC